MYIPRVSLQETHWKKGRLIGNEFRFENDSFYEQTKGIFIENDKE